MPISDYRFAPALARLMLILNKRSKPCTTREQLY